MKNFLYITLLLCISFAAAAQDGCRRCMENDVYCENDKEYYFCMNGEKLPGNAMKCPSNTVCSSADSICVNPSSSGNAAICPETVVINKCAGNTTCSDRYYCLSSTIYARCVDGEISGVFTCDKGLSCSDDLFKEQGGKAICGSKCLLDYFGYKPSCERYNLEAQCWLAVARGEESNYFYTTDENDDTCKNYMYCRKSENIMSAYPYYCSKGAFNPATNSCSTSYVCPKNNPVKINEILESYFN